MIELEEKKELIRGLKRLSVHKYIVLLIVVMIKTDNQLKSMMDWIKDHQNENPSQNEVFLAALEIVKKE